MATINLAKSPTFLGNFCKGVKSIIFLGKWFLIDICTVTQRQWRVAGPPENFLSDANRYPVKIDKFSSEIIFGQLL